jgi:hypothetical protein
MKMTFRISAQVTLPLTQCVKSKERYHLFISSPSLVKGKRHDIVEKVAGEQATRKGLALKKKETPRAFTMGRKKNPHGPLISESCLSDCQL